MEGARVVAACHGAGAFQILLPATLPEYDEYAGMENATGSHKKCIKIIKLDIWTSQYFVPYCAWLQCTLHTAMEDPPQVVR